MTEDKHDEPPETDDPVIEAAFHEMLDSHDSVDREADGHDPIDQKDQKAEDDGG